MNIIKKLRQKFGLTQVDLVEETGLSLRTIQRLERENKAPKGYSLKVLSAVFDIEPNLLHEQFLSTQKTFSSDLLSLKVINLSVLAFFGIPFGNMILPMIIWRKKRQSKLVDDAGRRIINFQIIWSVILCILLCISPFIDKTTQTSPPLILIVLFIAVVINLSVVVFTAISLHRNNLDFLNLPIQFL